MLCGKKPYKYSLTIIITYPVVCLFFPLFLIFNPRRSRKQSYTVYYEYIHTLCFAAFFHQTDPIISWLLSFSRLHRLRVVLHCLEQLELVLRPSESAHLAWGRRRRRLRSRHRFTLGRLIVIRTPLSSLTSFSFIFSFASIVSGIENEKDDDDATRRCIWWCQWTGSKRFRYDV